MKNSAAAQIQKRVRGMQARVRYGKKAMEDHAAASKLTIWFQTRYLCVVPHNACCCCCEDALMQSCVAPWFIPDPTMLLVAAVLVPRGWKSRELVGFLRLYRNTARVIQRGARDWFYRRRLKAAYVLQVWAVSAIRASAVC